MDWQPEQLDLGALGFAGICRETFRVLLGATILHARMGDQAAAVLSALLLAHITASAALLPALTTPRTTVPTSSVSSPKCSPSESLCLLVLLFLSLACTTIYVFRVASLYCTDGDSGAVDRILLHLPRAPVRRLVRMFLHVIPLAVLYLYILLSVLAWSLILDIKATASNKAVVLLLKLLGGSACLASAAYVGLVSHVACVAAALEDAVFLGALHKSRALLAGKFWAAAAVFVPLDCCFVALQISFRELVLEDALGIGIWLQVVAGVEVAVALWAVVAVTLTAQPVVYLVCKNHHHEVVDMVHLNYVGEYQQLDVDGERGVELQPVETTPQPTGTSAQPQPTDQSPAGSST